MYLERGRKITIVMSTVLARSHYKYTTSSSPVLYADDGRDFG